MKKGFFTLKVKKDLQEHTSQREKVKNLKNIQNTLNDLRQGRCH